MTNKQIIRTLRARQKEMAALRDKLRDLLDDVADEHERADDAYASLRYCIERLSETV